jgi:hypothetical protein
VGALRHGDHYRIVHESAGFANRISAISKRRSGRADVVEERHAPARNAGRITRKSSLGGKALRSRPSALRVARSLIQRQKHPGAGDCSRATSHERDAVETAHAPAFYGRRDRNEGRTARN